jgi:HNH endonuclease
MNKIDVLSRFWSKVNKQGPYPHKKACEVYPEIKGTKCWEWTACIFHAGHGQFRDEEGLTVKAHRFAYELHYGKGSLGKQFALHKCDNPKCVRWNHLYKGNQLQNMWDRSAKGRMPDLTGINTWTRGADNCKAKITKALALKISKLYKFRVPGRTAKALAKRFKLHRTTVENIIHQRTWHFKCK